MAKVLYLPIYDPSMHTQATANKHGLRTALEQFFEVNEFDYLAPEHGEMYSQLYRLIVTLEPHILLTQLQGTTRITVDSLRAIREWYPNLFIANWNGDYWPEHLTSPDMLALLKHVDVQLVTNGSVLDTYAEHGINAVYWPHSFEAAVRDLPDVPDYDVVFLGNCYSEHRKQLEPVLRSLPCRVGIYGSGWQSGDGECTYDFTQGEALYRKAKIAICDNEFSEAKGYLSNRPFQAWAAGCFVLHQRVTDLEVFTGYRRNVHYGEFTELTDISAAVEFWLERDNERRIIAGAGRSFTRREHSFEARVHKLIELLPEVIRA
jgi:glycosyltransferase involved in cell wall biosynthesis